jgi:hypothetical protein
MCPHLKPAPEGNAAPACHENSGFRQKRFVSVWRPEPRGTLGQALVNVVIAEWVSSRFRGQLPARHLQVRTQARLVSCTSTHRICRRVAQGEGFLTRRRCRFYAGNRIQRACSGPSIMPNRIVTFCAGLS